MTNNHRQLARYTPLWVGIASLLLYLPGLARQPLPGDSSIYVINAVQLNLNSYAQTHSLFLVTGYWFTRLLPFLAPPTAVSLLAALCASIAIGFVVAIIRLLGGGTWGAVVGGASLAVAHTMWHHAEFPEVYSMNAMFMAAMLYFVLLWFVSTTQHPSVDRKPRFCRAPFCLAIGMFLGGLGCANHLLVGLSLTVVAVWVVIGVIRERRPLRHLLWAAAGGVAGLAFLAALFLQDVDRLGFETAFQMLLTGGGGVRMTKLFSYADRMFRMSTSRLLRHAAATVALVAYNFAGPQLLMIPVGTMQFGKVHRVSSLMISLLLIHIIFPTGYAIHEFWAFLLPAWVVAAIAAGLGFEIVKQTLSRKFPMSRFFNVILLGLAIILPPLCYWTVPYVLARIDRQPAQEMAQQGKVVSTIAHYRSYLWPPKCGAGEAAVWANSALQKVPDGDVLMLRPALHAVAYYLQQIERVRPSLYLTGTSKRQMAALLESRQTVYTDNLKIVQEVKAMGLDPQATRVNGLWRIEIDETSQSIAPK